MGPRSISKRHGKRQNFKAAAWRMVCLQLNTVLAEMLEWSILGKTRMGQEEGRM